MIIMPLWAWAIAGVGVAIVGLINRGLNRNRFKDR